jgi:aspartyl-tRNA(Asn)/glutamyl-tRNA(Gln) amidotransferase subunit A
LSSRLSALTVWEASELLAARSIHADELLESQLDNIRRQNDELRAFITVFPGGERGRSGRGSLRGIPISIKDIINVKGKPTTAGSKVLQGYVPDVDAAVVRALKEAGATLTGKTNLHEFAFGVTNLNPHFGNCRNPWKKDRISGGSTGGGAVSVAAGMSCAAIGSDTAGSIRIPASLCGVVGYKPTYGLVSRDGVIPLSWSLDSIGFLTKSVRDAIILASVTFTEGVGAAPPRPTRAGGRIRPLKLKGLRLGIPRNALEPLEEDVRRRYEASLDLAEKEGARLLEIQLENIQAIAAARSIIAHAEAASYHRELMKNHFADYGKDVRERLLQGLLIPATTYLGAQRVRRKLAASFRGLFNRVDLLVLPTTCIAAPRLKTSRVTVGNTSMDVRTALLRLTEPFNLVGAPAISIPCGATREVLPVGLQLVGDVMEDQKLLSAALSFENLLPRLGSP